jgi:hypothetical protein
MARKPVWCLMDSEGVVRIFKNKKRAAQAEGVMWSAVRLVDYAEAVAQVRDFVWKRSEGNCEKCGASFTKDGSLFNRMHMDEKLARGSFDANGWSGEISRENSWGICYGCHFGPGGHHGGRRPRFGESA